MATKEYFEGTGRRKSSIARIQLFPGGSGEIKINNRTLEEYFPRETLRMLVFRPLVVTEQQKSVTIKGLVDGGGISSQAGAVAHGISRALLEMKAENRTLLKPEGLLTRDSRMKERKKYGQKGARKRFQFSKR